jgi:hypothetical protein
MLTPVDKLEVQVVVDNATDSLSGTPIYVESEFASLKRKGKRVDSWSSTRLDSPDRKRRPSAARR